jgi:nicotinate phosphoribosyltransferase
MLRGRYLDQLYQGSLGLNTDLYQLTMAYGYWKSGLAQRRAVFHASFRDAPFGGAFSVVAGVETVAEFIERASFDEADLAYLGSLNTERDQPLFDAEFLEVLARVQFSVDIDAMPEGSCHFPGEPVLRLEGTLLEAQLLETVILNLLNYQSMVATRAARICHLVVPGEGVLEFGLRRAPGLDGGLSASRAAWIGGCLATSNLKAGQIFGIPVAGTQAHSWVMSFDSEQEAFFAYSQALPDNLTLLVDTYDTLTGVERAITTGREARKQGFDLDGVRLDSGDLVQLSRKTRQLLDAAGFEQTRIIASNGLDEHEIERLKKQGAEISIWGVGTSLVTGRGQGTIAAVYKLSALEDEHGVMQPRAKRSEDDTKSSWPGQLQVFRVLERGVFVRDRVVDRGDVESDAADSSYRGAQPRTILPMLQPLLRSGTRVEVPLGERRLEDIRERVAHEIAQLPDELKVLSYDGPAPVEFDRRLIQARRRLFDAMA